LPSGPMLRSMGGRLATTMRCQPCNTRRKYDSIPGTPHRMTDKGPEVGTRYCQSAAVTVVAMPVEATQERAPG
jgi:hypothetical protein